VSNQTEVKEDDDEAIEGDGFEEIFDPNE